jgi:hypothetical protein
MSIGAVPRCLKPATLPAYPRTTHPLPRNQQLSAPNQRHSLRYRPNSNQLSPIGLSRTSANFLEKLNNSLHAFFLIRLALADITGVTFTAQQIITATTTFHECTFRGCQSPDNGGALDLDGETASLTGCLFEN